MWRQVSVSLYHLQRENKEARLVAAIVIPSLHYHHHRSFTRRLQSVISCALPAPVIHIPGWTLLVLQAAVSVQSVLRPLFAPL